ncbi:hypothetical protein C1141_21595, partial [Vibrio agarivorans]
MDEQGRTLAEGRDLAVLQRRLAAQMAAAPALPQSAEQEGREWCFGALPECREQHHAGLLLRRYPALVDRGDRVVLSYLADATEAHWQHGYGCARLALLALADPLRMLNRFAAAQPGFQKLKAEKSAMA